MKPVKQLVLCVIFGIAILLFWRLSPTNNTPKEPPRMRSSSSPKASVQMKKGRDEYFFMLLRDPATNQIPLNIRQRELEFAGSLRKLNKSARILTTSWKEAGPYDVGGRTRALAIDLNNSNTILAGGASGGIWKSTDNGNSWQIKSQTSQILSVTSIAQDPRPGNRNVWYYVSGELRGSGFDIGGTARYFGDGVYKSTDNGETWKILPSTQSKNQASWDGNFDNTNKVVVNKTGTVLVAANAMGIFRSSDGGNNFTLVLGGPNEHIYSDIVAASDGTLIAAVSSPIQGYTPVHTPGIYKSADDGQTWTNITPADFPASHLRSVLASAPSNPDVLYVFNYTGQTVNERDDIRFYKIKVSNGQYENRTTNMPDLGTENLWGGYIETQYCYNMTLAVKPDDENFVLLAATCMFRSTDGFATKPGNKTLSWIGGYDTEQNRMYPGLHCDIHSFSFDPADPNKMWWGHDGGLSYTTDIRNTAYSTYFPWQNKNHGYNVTQFYTVTLPEAANDNRIMGGTQDNGTPFFTFDGNSTSSSIDASSGDGAFCYFGKSFAYTSCQYGWLRRVRYDGTGNPSTKNGWSNIYPLNAKNQFFINPYAVDPNNENVMYYPSGNTLWRNNQLNSIPDYQTGTMAGWQELTNLSVPGGYTISAVGISTSPAHILYYGASNSQNTPKLYKLSNSAAATSGALDISVPGAASGSFINHIAVNPDNADEILVVMSNYNITGLYHSTNGGQTYTAIEGNLEGSKTEPGPSLRAAAIKNTNSGPVYLLGTSIGVFSAAKLNGTNTIWTQEGENTIGNVIVNYIASRKSDSRVIAGTHGRGAFTANINAGTGAIAKTDVNNIPIKLETNTKASSTFTISNTGTADLNFNIRAEYKGKAEGGNNQPKILPKAAYPNGSRYKSSLAANSHPVPNSISGNDILLLDNGDNQADNFLGYGDGSDFTWFNEFELNGFDFKLEQVNFLMRTESASQNSVRIIILDEKQDTLRLYQQNYATSAAGGWFTFNLPSPETFSSGQKFYIGISSYSCSINFPAGFDSIGAVQGKSYVQDNQTGQLINLNTVSGFEKNAFLIRAAGTKKVSGEPDRLSVTPESGTIAPGGSRVITVTVDAKDLPEGNYQGIITITSNGGNITLPVKITVGSPVIVLENGKTPEIYFLAQNYPNPFNPETNITFNLVQSEYVVLTIYDIKGREVKKLLDERKPKGMHTIRFNAGSLSSGVYLYNLKAGSFSDTRKLLYVK